MTEVLHRYHDNSTLTRTTIQELLKIPIWKGNRILDTHHSDTIYNMIHNRSLNIQSLDSGYRVIVYKEEDASGKMIEQRYVIDGQHRLNAIKRWLDGTLCEDFPITIIEKRVDNEADAIDHFNCINNTKPIQFSEDPVLLVNRYIEAVLKTFTSKKKLIRSMKTKRPYLSVDDLRNVLMENIDRVRKVKVQLFCKSVIEYNRHACEEYARELSLGMGTDVAIKTLAVQLEFALAVDRGLSWVNTILTSLMQSP